MVWKCNGNPPYGWTDHGELYSKEERNRIYDEHGCSKCDQRFICMGPVFIHVIKPDFTNTRDRKKKNKEQNKHGG
jgi:hypothetical protein